ncbi:MULTISPECIES: SDR family NAD(P)-dependent oxidoreductase [Nocardioides]|uniref:SDR family NAD(P)-dependent oxidoreductase n=1 Tax=Nocardioides vastitatis TaxID=2568655 RepID=A0ABW0ZJS8_9ACTN|nr:SDR family NAD(P)-dependent oxidoreductase [Nocardioides sp.]THJ05786.1 SDR family NAD(P)-dependent oxidoreductase [Nocardioides sp.]
MNRLSLNGRVALVTGGGAGIGLATARMLVDRGAHVAVVDRDAVAAEAAAAELGPRGIAIGADVTDARAMASAATRVEETFGGIDLVVANAGITPTPATLRRASPEGFARVLSVNVLGVLHTVQPAIDGLIARQGQVVVVASAAAYSPPLGGAAYMVSKAAAEVLARAFRLELAPHGVGVTTAAFGFVDTQLARATLDDHEVGVRLNELLPRPLKKRISADQAAAAILDATERRATRVTRPAAWAPLGVLRGAVGPAIDTALIRSGRTAELVELLEREG